MHLSDLGVTPGGMIPPLLRCSCAVPMVRSARQPCGAGGGRIFFCNNAGRLHATVGCTNPCHRNWPVEAPAMPMRTEVAADALFFCEIVQQPRPPPGQAPGNSLPRQSMPLASARRGPAMLMRTEVAEDALFREIVRQPRPPSGRAPGNSLLR
jgi:hypothetical protein